MIPLTFRLVDRVLLVEVNLNDETFRPLVGQLRMARPALAKAVELAGLDPASAPIELQETDISTLAVAARMLLESDLLDDPELGDLAQL